MITIAPDHGDCAPKGKEKAVKSGKVIACLGVVLALLVGAFGVYYAYWSYHPHMVILCAQADSDRHFEEEHHHETIVVSLSNHRGIPLADSVEENLMELGEWNNRVITDLYENYIAAAPYDIRVSGEVAGGKTTLRYEGYVTTPEGETIDYKEEMTFDFAYVSNEDLFQNNKL